jgi:hypothetical protein
MNAATAGIAMAVGQRDRGETRTAWGYRYGFKRWPHERCARCAEAFRRRTAISGEPVYLEDGDTRAVCVDCGAMISKGQRVVECTECDGTGSCDAPGRPFYPCATCRGDGVVPAPEGQSNA